MVTTSTMTATATVIMNGTMTVGINGTAPTMSSMASNNKTTTSTSTSLSITPTLKPTSASSAAAPSSTHTGAADSLVFSQGPVSVKGFMMLVLGLVAAGFAGL